MSTTYITCPADPKKTLGIKLPFLVMIIKNVKKYFTFEVQVESFRKPMNCLVDNRVLIFHLLLSRCWTTKMYDGDSGRATISRRPGSSRSYVQCPCDWTRAGIRSSSICLTLPDVPTVRITWRRSGCRSMQTAGYAESTFPIDCTARTSYRPSLNSSSPFRSHPHRPSKFNRPPAINSPHNRNNFYEVELHISQVPCYGSLPYK